MEPFLYDKLKHALNTSASGVIICDVHGVIEWVNHGFTAMTGYLLEEIIGKKPGSFLQGPNTDQDTIKQMSVALANRESFNVEILNYHRDGSEMFINLICDPIYDESRDCVGFLAFQPNITEEKRREITKRNEYLKLIPEVFEGWTYPMILVDDKKQIRSVNSATLTLLGYQKEVFLNFNMEDIVLDLASFHSNPLTNQVGKMTLVHKDGTELKVDYITSHDVIKGIHLFILIDIKDKLKHEEVMATKTSHLEKLNKENLQILSTLSHDIAGPMQNLGNIISLLKDNELSKEQFDLFLDEVITSFSNTKDFLKNIISWSSNQIHGIKINIEPVDLDAIVKLQIDFHQSMVRHISLKAHVQSPMTIHTDPKIVSLVLRNLISNAIKFCKSGDEIEVKVVKNDDQVVISVIDTGAGIHPDDINQIFDINFSKSTKSNPTGYGLGLNICKEFLEMMGEKIWVESKLNEGTAFHFTLSQKSIVAS